MRLPLVVEAGDSIRDGALESIGIGEGTVGELVLLEVAPASLDVVQLGGVFRQPFEGEPRARGERLCCQLAGVDLQRGKQGERRATNRVRKCRRVRDGRRA
jgi:hypothetical protein